MFMPNSVKNTDNIYFFPMINLSQVVRAGRARKRPRTRPEMRNNSVCLIKVQRFIQFDFDELAVVGLLGTYVPTHAEGIVVIVDDTYGFFI